MYDLVIIGGGPAGLSAAIYASRAKLNTIIIEKEPFGGSQIITTESVDNYPGLPGISGFDLAMGLRKHAEELGAKFVEDSVTAIGIEGGAHLVCGDKGVYEAKTVILATGARHKKLGAKGEDTFAGRGVSYCATCDGAFYKGKDVAVIGGGNVALEDALYLSKIANKVYLVHRRDEFRGEAASAEAVRNTPNIELVLDSVVDEILGGNAGADAAFDGNAGVGSNAAFDGNAGVGSDAAFGGNAGAGLGGFSMEKVGALRVKNVKSDELTEIPVSGVFVAVGLDPNTESFLGTVDDEGGFIITNEECETSVPGIFAAGDLRVKSLRQVITAAADGAVAVNSAIAYLRTR